MRTHNATNILWAMGISGLFVLAASPAAADLQTRAFTATLTNDQVIMHGEPWSTAAQSGSASFLLTWDPLNLTTAKLSYEIRLDADLDGLQTLDLQDDVTAIHLHNVTGCMMMHCHPGDTAHTMHVLNLLGTPRMDDADLQFFPSEGKVTGVWDETDRNSLEPFPSFAVSDQLAALDAGELFLMVHTRAFPDGAFGGYLVPEPTWGVAGLVIALTPLLSRRRSATVRE